MTDEYVPVSKDRIDVAKLYGLEYPELLALASREAEVPYAVACALMEKESGGQNVWGRDDGGFFSKLPSTARVTQSTFEAFEVYVVRYGYTSNGVGPAQITWRGFFPDARKQNLELWKPHDNMLYGLRLLHSYKIREGATWEDAGAAYNGARSYGVDFAAKVGEWQDRFKGLP